MGVKIVADVRDRVRSSVSGLFAHAERPLLNTADYPGDAGLCGPDSVSWRVIGDVSVFVGAIRALLIQAAHPEVVAGVEEHSRYRSDPLGRLGRTSFYVTTATYGAMPEVQQAVQMVRHAHRGVSGISHRGLRYGASVPEMAAWVHNTLTDSFLVAYQTMGPGLDAAEADRFVAEQSQVGSMLAASPLPRTANDLAEWVGSHPAIGPSPGMRNAVDFLSRPPLGAAQRLGYRVLMQGAVTTIPTGIADVLGLKARRGARAAANSLIAGLRLTMRNSPAWMAALERCGAQYDPALFRDPL